MMNLPTGAFDYELPDELVAQLPAERRDTSRLMVLDRRPERVSHEAFSRLPDLLNDRDMLVLNNTRVIPARFCCRRKTGGKIEGIFLAAESDGQWEVMLKNAGRCSPGDILLFDHAGDEGLRLVQRRAGGAWTVRPEPPGQPRDILNRHGRTPLPPYIKRPGGPTVRDRDRYQTVYAEKPGSVAAPTAGLHFTPDIFERLADKGIETAYLTLHVGYGTFAPVTAEKPSDHTMHSEWYELSADTAAAVARARSENRRIIAVGTTSARTLESVAAENNGRIVPCSGTTDLFIVPPWDFAVTGGLLTNFHLPRSTLLMLVAAFCAPGETRGIETLLHAYRTAIEYRYRFFSYGDAMLIV